MNPFGRLRALLAGISPQQDKGEKQIFMAAVVAAAFSERGIPAVLVGGAVVEYYTAGGYSTGDIDMILPPLERQEIETVMTGLGLERFEDYRHWYHPQVGIPVEFPPGPLQVGHLIIQEANEIIVNGMRLKILKVEDILLDRLIMAQEWKDPEAEVQAEMLMYAHYSGIDWSYVHQRTAQLGIRDLFQQVQKRVKRRVR